MAADLSDVDPVASALDWLKADEVLVAKFGSAEHISGLYEAPWPHLVVEDGPGGSLGVLRWATIGEVTLKVFDDPRGKLGAGGCRRLVIAAAMSLTKMTDTTPGEAKAVTCNVVPSGVASPNPQRNGQNCWVLGVLLTQHPNPAA